VRQPRVAGTCAAKLAIGACGGRDGCRQASWVSKSTAGELGLVRQTMTSQKSADHVRLFRSLTTRMNGGNVGGKQITKFSCPGMRTRNGANEWLARSSRSVGAVTRTVTSLCESCWGCSGGMGAGEPHLCSGLGSAARKACSACFTARTRKGGLGLAAGDVDQNKRAVGLFLEP